MKLWMEKEAKKIKRNVSKWREFAKKAVRAGGSSDKNIDEFVVRLMKADGKSLN